MTDDATAKLNMGAARPYCCRRSFAYPAKRSGFVASAVPYCWSQSSVIWRRCKRSSPEIDRRGGADFLPEGPPEQPPVLPDDDKKDLLGSMSVDTTQLFDR
jgi:hypothetical protein